jgi:hypothetical protein
MNACQFLFLAISPTLAGLDPELAKYLPEVGLHFSPLGV